jgi:hypothetical protein
VSAEAALIAGIIDALAASAAVKAALGDPARIFDDRAAGAAFPYAVVATSASRPADAAEVAAFEHEVSIEVWSREGGKADLFAALSAMREALHDQDIAVAGRRIVLLQVRAAEAARADDDTLRGVLRVHAITEAA